MDRAMMVGDNRDRPNVGCRATSIALSDLLATRFELLPPVTGMQIMSPQPPPALRGRGIGRKVANRASRSSIGWRASARLPASLRPDQRMAPPEQVARDWLDLQGRDPDVATLVRRVEAADVVVVNGEGDLIMTEPPRRSLAHVLSVIELAHLVGTPAVYVNAMVSDPPSGARNPEVVEWARHALHRCRLLTVRDKVSLALAQELQLHPSPRWVPDALFTWCDEIPAKLDDDPLLHRGFPYEGDRIDLEWEHYVCVGGSSAYQPTALRAPVDSLRRIVEHLEQDGHNPVLVESSDAEPYLREVARLTGVPLIPWATNIAVIGSILARSQLLVSGRHHPAILAALGGSRAVMFGSNSHKCTSLLELLGFEGTEQPAVLGAQDTSQLLEQAKRALAEHGPEARQRLRHRCVELAGLARDLPDLIAASLEGARR